MTVQKIICDKYKIKPSNKAIKQFESAYDELLAIDMEPIINKIFKILKDKPIECLTFKDNDASPKHKQPFNFILNTKRTLNILTNKSSATYKQAPQILGQPGYEVLNYYFSGFFESEIKTHMDIKKLIWFHSYKMIPIFLDFLFISDIVVWIYKTKSGTFDFIIITKEEKPELNLESKDILYTKKNLGDCNNSLTIKYNNLSIAEAQVHNDRGLVWRFNIKNLFKYLNEKKHNNETLGITAEKTICDIYKLKYPDHLKTRASESLTNEILSVLENATSNIPTPIKHSGSEIGVRGGFSKSSFDFILNGNKTLSLKTNWGVKVCPPEVGQPSAKTFTNYFGHLFENKEFTNELFKEICINKTSLMMEIYLSHLFDSDYLLWIYKTKSKKGYDYEIIKKSDFTMNWVQDKFSFTRDIEKWTGSSSTVKYDGETLGEFQVHSNRNSYVFRFNMKNLLSILKKEKEVSET